MNDPLMFGAEYLVPLLLGYLFCLLMGANRGVLIGGAVLPVVVLGLFYLLAPLDPEVSRFRVALGYMLHQAIAWVPAFLVGCAAGMMHRKRRQ